MNRSILVIEGINCNAEVRDREEDESREDENIEGRFRTLFSNNLLMQDDDTEAVLRKVMSFVEKRKVVRSKAKEYI
ncbi:hypothetical protein F2Q70_00022009 [Brassica cretica]|uniref:Uncharacterized protein n=2 Tax=Brassica cretica TaxID=69181 RepID=A0A8S9GSW8_BRACR|nr:hypothetical protein F2Q70_00022009 [Brassica cretica]KAF2555937.1 hypothetical protein F2Q68_00015798 [Brassica cretica]KAF3587713.1 hypothetical protein F2Q69_00029615 [Brassica cretica]KAF3612171.1 hypothetical protein DY000_02048364 [Brassica cretica]